MNARIGAVLFLLAWPIALILTIVVCTINWSFEDLSISEFVSELGYLVQTLLTGKWK